MKLNFFLGNLTDVVCITNQEIFKLVVMYISAITTQKNILEVGYHILHLLIIQFN